MGGIKGVILLGGPSTGTRFRPLSFQVIKPLFPVAGIPMIQHHLAAFQNLPEIEEVLLIGFYEEAEVNPFLAQMQDEVRFRLRYLREYQPLGTAGGLFHFRDVILQGSPELFIVVHADVAAAFPLSRMLRFHRDIQAVKGHSIASVMGVKKSGGTRKYGNMVVHPSSHELLHFVEKPDSFSSDTINSGLYIFSPEIFRQIGQVFVKKHSEIGDVPGGTPVQQLKKMNTVMQESIQIEQDVLVPNAGGGSIYVYMHDGQWCQIKAAESVLEANHMYLGFLRETEPDKLAKSGGGMPEVVGNVLIHKSAVVHPSAKLGPDVVISARARIGAGVRVSNSIVLDEVHVKDNACILNSIIGWRSRVGFWSRIQGTYGTFDENMFDAGKKNPGVTCIGQDVHIANEIIVRDCIVLPHKTINDTCHNAILL